MKPFWIPVLVGLMCAYSVCFAKEPNTYFEVKMAVHTDPVDPDLNLFVVGQHIRLVNLGIFQGLNGTDGFIARRALGSDPLQMAPSWNIAKPQLLADWFGEPTPHNLYIRLNGTESEVLKTLQLLHETSGTLILGDDVQMEFDVEQVGNYMQRKYIVETRTQNSFIKTKSGRFRIREVLNNCERVLVRI
jgi:hypothetical protein